MALLFLSLNYIRQGELELAAEHGQTCLQHSQRADDYQGMGWGFLTLAAIDHRRGQLKRALEHGKQALRRSEEARDRMWATVIRRELGEIHLRLGNNAEAIELLEKSVNDIRQHGLKHEFVMGSYATLAEARLAVLNESGSPTKTLKQVEKHCRQAMAQARKFPNWRGYATRTRALYERALGRRPQALHWLERSIELSAAMGARYDMALAYLDLGRLQSEGNSPSAENNLHEALRLFDHCGATLDVERTEQALDELSTNSRKPTPFLRGPHWTRRGE